MLSGVSIVCFASSYAIALALEVTRLFFRSGIRGAVMLGFAGAGLLAHSILLVNRTLGAEGSPLSSNQDWCLLAAWALVVVYLYLTVYHPKTPFGLFILPLVMGLVGAARFLADSEPFPREPASKIWGAIHGTSILLATVSVLMGFAAGLMYLGQARRLKRKLLPPKGLRLPSLEWLQRTNSRALVISLLMLGVGILAGTILNLINYERNADHLPWNDRVILSTLIMFGWLVLSTAVSFFYRPAREGHKVVYLTLVSFVFLVIALAAVLSLNTQHGGTRSESRGSEFRVQGSGLPLERVAAGLAPRFVRQPRSAPAPGGPA